MAAGIALAAWLIAPRPTDLSQYKFTPIARDEAPEDYPAWSPDGKSIAYIANVHGIIQVFTKVVGSSETAQLTHSAKSCDRPFWSPGGETIYFESNGDLWEVASSGGVPERLLDHATEPTLHPDGDTVLFRRDGKIWITSLRGGTPREFWWQAPRHSPVVGKVFSDGSKLFVFDGPDAWMVPYPSGTAHKIFSSTAAEIIGADWLPDSRHIVVSESGGPSSRLVLVAVADGGRQVIYSSSEVWVNPSVSPDGKRIA